MEEGGRTRAAQRWFQVAQSVGFLVQQRKRPKNGELRTMLISEIPRPPPRDSEGRKIDWRPAPPPGPPPPGYPIQRIPDHPPTPPTPPPRPVSNSVGEAVVGILRRPNAGLSPARRHRAVSFDIDAERPSDNREQSRSQHVVSPPKQPPCANGRYRPPRSRGRTPLHRAPRGTKSAVAQSANEDRTSNDEVSQHSLSASLSHRRRDAVPRTRAAGVPRTVKET